MESDKGSSSSCSSFANDLFGPNDSTSSNGVFGSIFGPPSKIMRRDACRSEMVDKKNDALSENSSKVMETDENQSSRNKTLNAIFEGERGLLQQPCNLSSSIYYGGQDVYFTPEGSQSSSSFYKKGVEDDDPHSASRGDWWQGSVYY